MQVNKINGYYIPKANFNNVKTTKPISFGEEVDCYIPDTQGTLNLKINLFVDEAKSFRDEAKENINNVYALARKAYNAGEKIGFARYDNEILKADNDSYYDLKCSKNKEEKIITLKSHAESFEFHYKDDKTPYFAKWSDLNSTYALSNTPDGLNYTMEDGVFNKTRNITFNYGGYTYEEKNASEKYNYRKVTVKRNLFKKPKIQYIESKKGSKGVNCIKTYGLKPNSKDWTLQ